MNYFNEFKKVVTKEDMVADMTYDFFEKQILNRLTEIIELGIEKKTNSITIQCKLPSYLDVSLFTSFVSKYATFELEQLGIGNVEGKAQLTFDIPKLINLYYEDLQKEEFYNNINLFKYLHALMPEVLNMPFSVDVEKGDNESEYVTIRNYGEVLTISFKEFTKYLENVPGLKYTISLLSDGRKELTVKIVNVPEFSDFYSQQFDLYAEYANSKDNKNKGM